MYQNILCQFKLTAPRSESVKNFESEKEKREENCDADGLVHNQLGCSQ